MSFLLRPWRQTTNRLRPKRLVLRFDALEDRTVPSTLTVTSAADSGAGSLRAAIAAANSGDLINFDPSLAGQTIALTSGELAITQSLDIEGPGAALLTISGSNASRVFDVSGSSTNVEIAGLTIADGLATGTTAVGPKGPVTLGGGILNTGAHVTLSGVALADNQASAPQVGYVQTNLVSDLASENAQLTDANLKNPWGLAFGPDGSFSISDQKANVDTQYAVTAGGVSSVAPTIAIPTTATGPQGVTGQVSNDTSSFLVNGVPATLIFADNNGTISAWNSSTGTTAQVEATTSGAANYTGLDIGSNDSGDFLYAANPKQGRIDVYNSSFALTNLGPNAFVDPQLPAGLVPFNVDNLNGDLYVMYVPAGGPVVVHSAPEGVGAVAVFDTSGNFIEQLISGGKLASPWGITLAPSTFGKFGGDLLVGNFSYNDPAINAFDPVSGAYLGTVADTSGNKLLGNAQGLWYLTFGNGGNGGDPNTLYFTTGLNGEADGLFGAINPVSSIAEGGAVANVFGATLAVTASSFTNNESTGAIQGRAGALANDLGSTLVLDYSTFAGNQATSLLGAGLLSVQGNALGGALVNVSGSRATVSHSTFAGNSARGGDGADGGPGQNGGNAGTGAGGAVHNDGGSLLGPFAPSIMTVEDSLFLGNQAIGGTGGQGGAGGNGGNASGLGVGPGAINNGSSTLTVSHSLFLGNESIGGNGGSGGAGGNGGAGSAAAGGAIASVPTPSFGTGLPPVRATLHVSNSLFLGNEALGGAGGAGGSGGSGGSGGAAHGGGLSASLTDWDVSHGVFVGNQAIGGAGGAQGGNGGAGQGGSLINVNGSIGTVSGSVFVLNAAIGGSGGSGGNGGNGQGGGAFNDATSNLVFSRSVLVNNKATGGAAGLGGSGGQGVGGGLYLTSGGTACADRLTIIVGNHASTSNDDVFGNLGPC